MATAHLSGVIFEGVGQCWLLKGYIVLAYDYMTLEGRQAMNGKMGHTIMSALFTLSAEVMS